MNNLSHNLSVRLLPFHTELTQHLGDRANGIPVPCGSWDAKEPVNLAEVADDFHVAPVNAEDEPVVPRDNFQQPLAAGRKTHRR